MKKNVTWDYTERAATYDKRADYSQKAISKVIEYISIEPYMRVADIGAGTGKLSKELLSYNLNIHAVEPNEAMRNIGIQNTLNKSIEWFVGTGEQTGLESNTYTAVFFGSSFNVVNQDLALKEVSRILKKNGYFCCMWNHRNLNDPLQNEIESCIKSEIDGYDYGVRRMDPSEHLIKSDNYSEIKSFEGEFQVIMEKNDIVDAWKSHATLSRQAGKKLEIIMNNIQKLIPQGKNVVPYKTRVWVARHK